MVNRSTSRVSYLVMTFLSLLILAVDTLRESTAVSLSLHDANCRGASIDICVPG